MSGAEEEAECRICGDLVPTSELVEPCGCRGGMRWPTRLVFRRGSTDKGPGRRNDSCEVCGEAWVGEYDVPEPSVQSPEEYAHRMHVLLSSAYVRVMMDVPARTTSTCSDISDRIFRGRGWSGYGATRAGDGARSSDGKSAR